MQHFAQENKEALMNPTNAAAETAQPTVALSGTDTRLSGRRLVLARLMALSLSGLSVGLLVASIPSYFAFLHLLCTGTAAACGVSGQLAPGDALGLQELGLSIDFFATYTIVVTSIFALGYWLVAALLFWRKSDNRMALFTVVCLGTFPIAFNSGFMSILSSPWWFLAHVISFLGDICIVLFFYVFPTGHFVPRWTRFVLVPTIAYWGFIEFFPLAPFNPFFRFPVLNSVVFLGVVGSMVVVQVYRYRRVSTSVQRQQTKWVVFGVSMSVGGFLVLYSLARFFPSLFPGGSLANVIATLAVYGLLLLLPLSIGFAILHSRLWDIDIIINRTLVFGMLTVILALVYVGLVIGLQALLRGIISQDSSVAIVISTLAIAALFQPLRARIQKIIDRRFYRSKYDAAKTMAAFSATLRQQVDLDQLREHLLAVVQETMQPAHVSLWLRPPEHGGKQRSPWRTTPPGSSEER
jgi:hypothetical protein